MKKIYILTLDDDIPLTFDVSNNLREIAYLLYSELDNYYKEVLYNVEKDRRLILNELHDINNGSKYVYRFISENNTLDYRMYEPFIINNNAFGFTVNSESITDEELQNVLNYVLNITNLNYHFKISSTFYNENNLNNRFNAINKLLNREEYNIENENKYVKTRKKTIFTKIASLL